MAAGVPVPAVIRAAGGVLWRPADNEMGLEIALIHRRRYDDWSLPKGKLNPDEHPIVGACREVLEETGSTVSTGRALGELRYDSVSRSNGRPAPKTVRYWSMRHLGGEFQTSDEVDDMRWVPPADALAALTWPHDRGPVQQLLAAPAATTALLLVRHGHAGRRGAWPGNDRLRPLDALGIEQAVALAEVGPCFSPAAIHSVDLTRCVDTVAPLAARLELPIELEPALSESAHASRPARAIRRLREIASSGRHSVVCSQGGAIPGSIGALCAAAGLPVGGTARSRKGSVWVLSFDGVRLVAADYLPTLAGTAS